MYKKTLLSTSIILACSPMAFAQDFDLFDEVVVSATRTSQQLDDVAASVTVVTDEDIEANLSNSIEDVLKYTPGVTVQGDSRQGVQSINVRGLEGNRVKIIVDGVSQANQFENSYAFINSGRVDVDVDMLKSVEIVKGAASSLQGSDAIGGIVAFETKSPADFLKDGKDVGGHAKFGYSSADATFTESVAVANRFDDVETLIAYTRKDGEELDNFGETYPLETTADNLLGKLQIQLNDDHRLEFTGEYIDKDAQSDLTNSNRNSSGSYDTYLGDDTETKTRIGVKHLWATNTNFADNLEWQLDYLNKESNGLTDRVSSSNTQNKDYVYEESGLQFNSQFDKFITLGGSEHYLVYGFSYSNRDISNVNHEYNSSSADKIVYYVPDATETKYGLFLQDEIAFGDSLIVTPGIRYDSYKTDPNGGIPNGNDGGFDQDSYKAYEESAVTGRLGVTWSVNDEHKLFAQISQGFRAPDFQELYYSFANAAHRYTASPNPDLKAEESISYELGWRVNNRFVRNEIAVFQSEYDNFIERLSRASTNPAFSTEYYYDNVTEATIKGIELSNMLDWHEIADAPKGLTTSLVAAYTKGEDNENNPLNSIMPWNAIAGINFDAPSKVWGTSLKVSYTAKKKEGDIIDSVDRYGNPEGKFAPDASTVVDLTAYYRPIEDLTIRGGIFNLTDEEYYNWTDVRGQSEEDKFYTQAGRNFSVTVKYDF
ncbi:TonB-dependent hemoglobin/transferrin/lactoferrin family receptor [Vibrio intestinalis]|uniref:TonB-dependent hemoglobin/transferrin/lactoferrin family receptor n=1 Tax=Vibrio intestinalis TaxID=2933291 RepID=UPI0021A3B060|nr:TonB-dependent hemoglobin/transferrin/lactoferrin family receptor [Vibrio intestinalis]